MSSDLNAGKLESATPILIQQLQSGLNIYKNDSRNERETQYISVETNNLEQRDLYYTG